MKRMTCDPKVASLNLSGSLSGTLLAHKSPCTVMDRDMRCVRLLSVTWIIHIGMDREEKDEEGLPRVLISEPENDLKYEAVNEVFDYSLQPLFFQLLLFMS